MADITITAANVVPGAGAKSKEGTAGETITAGKAIAISPTTGQVVLADSNHATIALRIARGIALNGASAGQPVRYQTSGRLTIGGTLTAGVAYFLSDTAGGICPAADVGTGERSVLLGVAKSTSVLEVNILDSGVAL
jgi:hypothetical protein